MESNEFYFGLVLGLIALCIGLAFNLGSALGGDEDPVPPPSVVAQGYGMELPPLEYEAVAQLTTAVLEGRARHASGKRLLRSLGAYAGGFPKPFTGVLFLRHSSSSVDEILSLYHDNPDFMEGPPFHLIADESGRLSSTRRWREGKAWHLAHESPSNGWIIICLAGCEPGAGDVPLFLKQLARRSPTSESGLKHKTDLVLKLGQTTDLDRPMTQLEWPR